VAVGSAPISDSPPEATEEVLGVADGAVGQARTRFADATACTLPVVSTDVGVVSNWWKNQRPALGLIRSAV